MDPVPFGLLNFEDKREKKIDSKMLRTLIFLPLFFHLGEAQSLNPVDQELVEASLQGDLETIKEIISNHKLTKDAEKNPKIHWEDAVTTPLHLAAGNGHLDIVKFYQEALEEDISSPNNSAGFQFTLPTPSLPFHLPDFFWTYGATPLDCAIFNLQVNVVEFYLDYYEEKIPKLVKKLADRFYGDEARMKFLDTFLSRIPYESFSATMFRDFKLFIDAINVMNRTNSGFITSDSARGLDNGFQFTLTTPSLPFHLPDFISNALIERASNNARYHWHLEVTNEEYVDIRKEVGLLRLLISSFFANWDEIEKAIKEELPLWFKDTVKVTEFEDGAQFNWTLMLPRRLLEQHYPNGAYPKSHIKIRIVVDKKPEVYFSKLITRKYSYMSPCFEIIQSTIL